MTATVAEEGDVEFDDSPPEFEPEREPCPEFSAALLNVPGFISRVMEHNLVTAHRPQPTLALGGALALQSALAGRQLADEAGTRTNMYILALAGSGCGKERAR